MPGEITTTLEEKMDLTVHKCRGNLRFKDIEGQIEKFYNGKVTKHTIWDFSEADSLDLSAQEVRKVAIKSSSYGRLRKGGCTAIIVKKELDFGLSRMFTNYAEAEKTQQKNGVFYTAKEALDWIRLTAAGSEGKEGIGAGKA